MEKKHGKTIYCMRGKGYKIASEEEKALYFAQSCKRTLASLDRAKTLHSITDKRYLPDAIKRVFKNDENVKRIVDSSYADIRLLLK